MTLRRKLFLFVTFSFSFAVAVGVVHQWSLYRKMVREEEERFCRESLRRYTELVEYHKRVANSISSYIAKDPEVKELFLRNDREGLYRKLRPLYEEVSRERLIREMQIFKLPAVSYLNIRNPKAPRRNVEKVRADVVRTGKTCTSTRTILICTNYVGIRATNPIAEGGKALGAVSVGVDMSDFIKRYKELTGIENGIAVKDEVLRKSLLENNYRRYLKGKAKSGDLVIDQTGKLNPALISEDVLSSSPNQVGDILLCSLPIEDLSGSVIGYFFAYRNVSGLIANLALEGMRGLFFVYLPSFLVLFAVWVWVAGSLSRRVEDLLRITNLIKKKRFEGLDEEELKDPRDEIDLVRNAIVETGMELRKFIEVLSKEVEVFSGKAYTDALTGVLNRRALEEFGVRLIERTLSIGKPVSLFMIDIDNFKEVNDTHGHQIGDEVLRQVAETIRGTLRDSDLVFRYGGEEFLVVLPGTSVEGALKAAENVRKRVEVRSFRVGGTGAKAYRERWYRSGKGGCKRGYPEGGQGHVHSEKDRQEQGSHGRVISIRFFKFPTSYISRRR